MEVVKAPNVYFSSDKFTVFLGGVIDQGKADDWAERICNALSDKDILVLNPRRDNWDASLKQSINCPEFKEQVLWELNAQEYDSDLIVYVFASDEEQGKVSLAPITLFELGMSCKRGLCYSSKELMSSVVVCCPKSYWRRGNVEVITNYFSIPLFDNLDLLIDWLKIKVPNG